MLGKVECVANAIGGVGNYEYEEQRQRYAQCATHLYMPKYIVPYRCEEVGAEWREPFERIENKSKAQ